ncbi:ulp1 protease family, C-terminal catalytic domain-containing protein [Tanacetum coccineum]
MSDGIGGTKNTCMSKRLYIVQKKYKDLHECPVCMESRYKHKNLTKLSSDVTKNGPPAKLLWCLPIIPRLKKLYANPKDAKLLCWQAKECKNDEKMRHVADSPQWKNIDRDFKKFRSEIGNIRFRLCLDGINPFKSLSSRHSTWLVLLCIYNLPPWLCMKRKYIMMSLLIQGLKQPGNDIDVYLRPLIEDMKYLWETSVDMYDAYKKERFQLFAMIYCTINDFPAYGNLSGYGTKGEKACPVCEKDTHSQCLLGLLLNIPGKTKDGVNARRDMVEMGIRKELAPQDTNGTKMYLPPACYTLSKAEKTSFCKCLHGVKVPSGYSANIKNLVSMKDLKLLGMKSHDCHILLTQMIPIAIRGLMPSPVRQTITKLCLFFNMIHSKVIDHEKLDELQRDIILILCQLEMYFPPSFFDVMVHLMSHIVEEIKLAGPVFLRYMYPFERYMGFLKGYVRNRYRPEGSIVQGYAAEEVVQFCTNYMDDVADIGLPQPRHQGRLVGVGTIGRKDVTPTIDDFEQAHFTVLQNMTCIEPYIHEHMSYLAENNSRRDQRWLEAKHERTFSQWLADKVICMSPTNVDADVIHLGYRPRRVLQYQGYDINRCTFYTKQQDEKKDPKDKRWHIVLHSKRSIVGVDDVVDEDEYNQFDELPPFSIGVQYTDDDPLEPRTRKGINRIQDLPEGESVEFNQFRQVVELEASNKGRKNFLWSDIKKLRAQVSERGKQHISWPQLGPKGYRGFEKQWQEERNNPDKATKLHLIPNIHGSNYYLAWAPRDKNGIKTLPPELIDVSKNLVQATRELAQGSNKAKVGVDPLILVLGPEHGGRTKGSGMILGIKKELKDMLGKIGPMNNEKILKRYEKKQDDVLSSVQMRSNLSSTTSMVRNEKQAQQNESFSPRQDDVPSLVQRRSNLSSTNSIVRKEQQAEHNESISTRQYDVPSSVQMRSNLSSTTSMVRNENSILTEEKVICATATVYLIGDGILHFKKLLKGHIKVSVIKVVEIHKSMELLVSDDEIPNLESVVKGFIQWPIATVARFTGLSKTPVSGVPTKRVMPQHENAPSTKKGKGIETPKEPNKKDKALEETTKHLKTLQKIVEVKERDLEDDILLNRPQSVIDGYNCWMSSGDYAEPYAIHVNKEVFRQVDESYFAINATDIIELPEQ